MTNTVTRSQRELTNARTRLVGTRQGVLADGVVALVRTSRHAREVLLRYARRLGAIVTGLGWSLAVVVPAALLAGYALGWREAAVIGWSGLALVVLSVFYLIGRTGYDIRLSLPAIRVVVGDKAAAEVIVANPTPRRLAGARIEIPVGHGLAEFAMGSQAPGSVFDEVFLVPTYRRGVIRLGPVRTVRADPVGLLRREQVWAHPVDLFVHPRTIAIPSMSTGFIRDLEGSPTRDLTASDISFHALREYVPGDERRNIHWRSTAKTGSYMVRQFEETRRSHLMVVLSLAGADFATEEEFELAVSVAGSLGVRAIRDSRTVSVVASAVTPEFAKRAVYAVRTLTTISPSRLLDDLATVETAQTALRLTDLARVAADGISGMSIAFLVCGSSVTAAQLRLASTVFPPGVEVVIVVCDPGRAPGLRSVAGLNVLTIGFLEDLQKSLARSRAV